MHRRVAFIEVGPQNIKEVTALHVLPEQVGFVESVQESFDWARGRANFKSYAIVNGDGKTVGFIMFRYGTGDEAARTEIATLLIDASEQRRGYGKAALALALEYLAEDGVTRCIHLDYNPDNTIARHMYRQAGFVERYLDDYGEFLMEKHL